MITDYNYVDTYVLKMYSFNVILRFVNYLEFGLNGCIEFNGSITDSGYGRFSVGSRDNRERIKAHRWVMGLILGGVKLPSDVFVCHKCDNPLCINPEHLFLGTAAHNNLDKINKGRQPIVYGNAKLNWNIIDDIRSSNLNGVEISKKWGVAESTISEIRTNKIWKDEHREKAII